MSTTNHLSKWVFEVLLKGWGWSDEDELSGLSDILFEMLVINNKNPLALAYAEKKKKELFWG